MMDSKSIATGPTAALGTALRSVGAKNLRKPSHITKAPSLRVPVTPANREYLRALRQAELAAWEAMPASKGNAALRREVQQTLRDQRSEARVLTGITAIALLSVAVGLAASLNFVEHWREFVGLVRQLLG